MMQMMDISITALQLDSLIIISEKFSSRNYLRLCTTVIFYREKEHPGDAIDTQTSPVGEVTGIIIHNYQ